MWDDYIGEIQLSLNTINKSTGKSPSELSFGCRLVNPCENIINDVICSTNDRISGDDLSNVRSGASERVQKQELAKKNFDRHKKLPTIYKIGDLQLVRIERAMTDKAIVGKSKKLVAKFQGPYRIVKIVSNDRYLVEDTPITRKGNRRYENTVAINKLHPWLNFNGPSSDDNDDDSDSDSEKKKKKTIETNQNNMRNTN